jgi:hypothetical protein
VVAVSLHEMNRKYDQSLSISPDTISIYYNKTKFRVVGHSNTVLCQHQECKRLPINDKRHYA